MSKRKQKSITAFLHVKENQEKKCVTITNDGVKKLCDICGESFYAQGWVQHRRSHSEVARLCKKPACGKVKVRGELYSKNKSSECTMLG